MISTVKGFIVVYRKIFGERLRAIRRDAGLTQQQVGDLFQSKKSRISHFEKGDSMPPFDDLATLADYFNVSLDWLVGREAFAHPPQAGGEQMEKEADQRLMHLESRLDRLERLTHTLERVVRSRIQITPAEWNRLLGQPHGDE